MAQNKYYLGSDLKFQVDIEASGFNQATDAYNIDLYCGNRKLSYTQDDLVESEGNYYLLVNTDLLKPGSLKIVITAKVPDTMFETNIRREIDVKVIGNIQSVV